MILMIVGSSNDIEDDSEMILMTNSCGLWNDKLLNTNQLCLNCWFDFKWAFDVLTAKEKIKLKIFFKVYFKLYSLDEIYIFDDGINNSLVEWQFFGSFLPVNKSIHS